MQAPDPWPIEPLAAVRFAAEILAPPRCAICGAPAASARLLCPLCGKRVGALSGGRAPLRLGRGPVERVSWACAYDGVARELVAALKFAGRIGLAEIAATAIADRLTVDAGTCVVPVPAAPLRRRRRGFDPGELIATRLAKRLGLELTPCLARRSGRRQVGRRRVERLAGAPRVRLVSAPPNRVLLIDDVLTTGATLGACAAALAAAGSAQIEAAVFARALGGTRAEA